MFTLDPLCLGTQRVRWNERLVFKSRKDEMEGLLLLLLWLPDPLQEEDTRNSVKTTELTLFCKRITAAVDAGMGVEETGTMVAPVMGSMLT